MKTVQQHLRELDTDELLDRYFFDHPIEYRLPDFDGYTVAEIRRRNRDCMRRFIERLTGLEVRGEKNGRTGILFACRFMGDGFEPRTEDYCLVFTDEVLRDGADAKVYSYDLTEQDPPTDLQMFRILGTPPDKGPRNGRSYTSSDFRTRVKPHFAGPLPRSIRIIRTSA